MGEKKSLGVLYKGQAFESQGQGRFMKDVLRVGHWTHPVTGQSVDVTPQRLEKLLANTERYMRNGNKLPYPKGHTTDPEKNLGFWTNAGVIQGGKLFMVCEPKADGVAEKMSRGTIDAVSVNIEFDHKDPEGNHYDEVITHVCATNYPVVTRQGEFLKLDQLGDRGGELHVPSELAAEMKTPLEASEATRRLLASLWLTNPKHQLAQALNSWSEADHPRDDRGRFESTGGESVARADETLGHFTSSEGEHYREREKLEKSGTPHRADRSMAGRGGPQVYRIFNKRSSAEMAVAEAGKAAHRANVAREKVERLKGKYKKLTGKDYTPLAQLLEALSGWNEADHPRDEDGKFSESGGGGPSMQSMQDDRKALEKATAEGNTAEVARLMEKRHSEQTRFDEAERQSKAKNREVNTLHRAIEYTGRDVAKAAPGSKKHKQLTGMLKKFKDEYKSLTGEDYKA